MSEHCCPVEAPSPSSDCTAEAEISRLAALARALADETRLTLLETLVQHPHPLCVRHLVERTTVGQPTVSHHLRILREAQLVTAERRGTWMYYQATPLARELLRSLHELLSAIVAR